MNLDHFIKSDISFAGLSGDLQIELLGQAQVAPRATKIAFGKKIAQQPTASNSRSEFQKRMNLLPKPILENLGNARSQLVDHIYYAMKSAAGKSSIQMFVEADNRSVGVTNVNNAKLPKDMFFLVHGIQILSVASSTPLTAAFDTPTAQILQGEINFRVDGKYIVPQYTPLRHFSRPTTEVKGLYKLDNPKMIEPERKIELELEFADVLPVDTHIWVGLVGTVVAPY